MLLGAHMSISKGFTQALRDSVEELNCYAMQIFLKSPRNSRPTILSETEIASYQDYYQKSDFQYVVGHSSYLLNLAKPLPSDHWQFQSLIDDFEKLSHLYGQGLVYHVGKHLALTPKEAQIHLLENLKLLLDQVSKYNIPLLLENCAGQGTEMGLTLEEIAEILQAINSPSHLKVCLDTCHLFSAGHDLSTPDLVNQFFHQIQNTITFQNLGCIHLNDSKTPFNSRRDRHENLGQGTIPKDSLRQIVSNANQHEIPLILETPYIDNSHLTDVLYVKALKTF